MSTEQNKAITRRIVAGLSQGDLSVIDELFAATYVEHAAPPDFPPGREGVKRFFSAVRAAFPDFSYTIDDEIAEGDKVVQRVTGRGTMQGEFMGMTATGKQAAWTEIHVARLVDGKVVEHWANIDQLGMLQQLGLVPTSGQA
jgi:predicted ester cyclase